MRLRRCTGWLLCLLVSPWIAHASTDLGQFCFLFQEFGDILRVDATQAGGPGVVIGLKMQQRAQSSYQMGGSGVVLTAFEAPEPDFIYEMFGTMTHATEFFGNNHVCGFHAYLRGGFEPLNGPWFEECVGVGAEPFQVSGTLIMISCDSPEAMGSALRYLPPAGGK